MRATFEDHPFWDFSLAVYGAEGVSAACIALQERHGVDVNVLLFCAWMGASGHGRLTPETLDSAIDAVGAWNREVVCGLRKVRRWMRDADTGVALDLKDALRRRIIDIEVQCEHAEQLALVRGTPSTPPGSPPPENRMDEAVANCALYLERLGAAPDAEDRKNLATILAAAVPPAALADILARLERPAGDSGPV